MGGGGSNLLFDSLRLWKNVEAHQDIYGFTRAPETEFANQAPEQERARPRFYPPATPRIEPPQVIAVVPNAEEE